MERKWYHDNVEIGPPSRAVFAIQNDTGTIVGLAQLMNINAIHRNASLGIFIGAPDERGKGRSKDVMRELLDFGFNSLNLLKVFLFVNADNVVAIKLYESFGFEHEGCLRKHYFKAGQFVDVLILSLLNDSAP